MAKLLRLLLLIVALPLVYALVVEAYLFLRAEIVLDTIRWFLYGLVPTFFIYLALTLGKSPNIVFVNTFRHELTHAFVSILFFQFPELFLVDTRKLRQAPQASRRTSARPSTRRRRPARRRRSPRGGRSVRRLKVSQITVGQTGPARGDFLNALAPYFLPLFTLPFLLLRPFAPGVIVHLVDLLIGATYAFHLVTAITEFGLHQTDVTRTGVIFSFTFVVLMHVLFLLIILLVVSGNYATIAAYFRAAWARALVAYSVSLVWLKDSLLPALQRLWEDVAPEWARDAAAI